MTETPFYLSLPSVGYNYRDQWECPSVHYSKDGYHWENVIDNPLDKLTDEEIMNRDYFSDPDLVETPFGLECWYRLNRRYGVETNQENILLLRRKSDDGLHWSEREVIADLKNNDPQTGLGNVVISQSVLFEDNKYKCWYVDDIHLHKERICFSESSDDAKRWTEKTMVKLNGPDITPWHLHVMKDNSIYWLTLYDHKNISIFKGNNEYEFNYVKTILKPCKIIGSFYSHNLYRACLLKIRDNMWRLYFSADDMFRSYIGIMEGKSPSSLEVVSAYHRSHIIFKDFLSLILKTKKQVFINKYQLNVSRVKRLLKRI